MPIVLFDLDNTLLDREAAFARWAEAFRDANGLPAETPAFLVEADGDGFRPREALFTDVRARYGLATSLDDLIGAYHVDYPTHFTFPDESRAALRHLRRAGWAVGVVTNGPASQLRKLDVTGLHEEVDAVCVSGLIDSWKPDPGIFVEAARRCGVDLDGWMVGDSGPADIRGGQAVGLRTIWCTRDRVWDLGPPEPDALVADVPTAVRIILGEDDPD